MGPSIKSIWDQTLGTFGSNHEIRAEKCAGGTEFCQNHMRGQPYGRGPKVKEEKEEGQNKRRRSSKEAPPTPKERCTAMTRRGQCVNPALPGKMFGGTHSTVADPVSLVRPARTARITTGQSDIDMFFLPSSLPDTTQNPH